MNEIRDAFHFEWHGDVLVVAAKGNVESMPWDLIPSAAEIVLQPTLRLAVPMVIFDLAEVNYFGSAFLQLLLRCHTLVKTRGGELVLASLSERAAELLEITALDTLWAIYESRDEALEALIE